MHAHYFVLTKTVGTQHETNNCVYFTSRYVNILPTLSSFDSEWGQTERSRNYGSSSLSFLLYVISPSISGWLVQGSTMSKKGCEGVPGHSWSQNAIAFLPCSMQVQVWIERLASWGWQCPRSLAHWCSMLTLNWLGVFRTPCILCWSAGTLSSWDRVRAVYRMRTGQQGREDSYVTQTFSAHTYTLLSHRVSIIKHKFTDKTIKKLKTSMTQHQTKNWAWGPCNCTGWTLMQPALHLLAVRP